MSGAAAAALVASVLLFGFAFLQWRAAQADRAARALVAQQYDQEVRDLRSATRRLQIADAKLAQGRSGASATPRAAERGETSPGAGAAADGPSPADRARADGQRFLAAFPQAREMINRYGRAAYEVMYGPFLRSAGLEPAQVERLEAATMEAWTQSLVLTRDGGINAGTSQPPDALLKDILGEAAFQQFQDYTRALPAQAIAVQVATGAGLAAAPLSPDAAAEISKIVAANSAAFQGGKRVNLAQVDWAAALAALDADGHLSPPQQQAAQRVFLTRQYQASLSDARRAASPNP